MSARVDRCLGVKLLHPTRCCDECPWRRDQPAGRFPPARYKALRGSCEQGLAPMFACHKSPEAEPFACAGYVLVEGGQGSPRNFNLRMALARGRCDPRAITTDPASLWPSFEAMAAFNGCDD